MKFMKWKVKGDSTEIKIISSVQGESISEKSSDKSPSTQNDQILDTKSIDRRHEWDVDYVKKQIYFLSIPLGVATLSNFDNCEMLLRWNQ